MEEVEWANFIKRKHGELPVENQCWSCAMVLARAYPGRTWAEVVAQAKTSEQFAQTFRTAKAVLGGSSEPSWLRESVSEGASCSCRLQISMILITEEEFAEQHNIRLAHFPEIQSKFAPIPGLGDTRYMAVRDPEAPHRKLLLEQAVSVSSHSKIMEEGVVAARAGQGACQLHSEGAFEA